jgi:hypothetical protein
MPDEVPAQPLCDGGAAVAGQHEDRHERQERRDEDEVVGQDEGDVGECNVRTSLIATSAPKYGIAVGSSVAMMPAPTNGRVAGPRPLVGEPVRDLRPRVQRKAAAPSNATPAAV